MSITRLKSTSKTPRKSFFTMVELIAVISITAILLTITIKIMKTDSTKANAQTIGGALSYAQSYAMSKLNSSDDDSDGLDDEYVLVDVNSENGKVTIYKFDSDTSVDGVIISEESLVAGSKATNSGGTETRYQIGFRTKGDPIQLSSPSDIDITSPPSVSASDTISTQVTIYVTHNTNTSTQQIVRIKPFTGKITYY